jgi:hypothetical protein
MRLHYGTNVKQDVPISPTFYEQLLCQNPFAKKLQTQIVSTQKLHKTLSYKKAAHKIMVKLTPGIHAFIQSASFLPKSSTGFGCSQRRFLRRKRCRCRPCKRALRFFFSFLAKRPFWTFEGGWEDKVGRARVKPTTKKAKIASTTVPGGPPKQAGLLSNRNRTARKR